MLVTQILDNLTRESLIDLFGLAPVQNTEAKLSDKNGKPSLNA